jgi:MOSC domain-containing protein YiiM
MLNSGPLQQLLDTLPQRGRVEWIGIRPERGAEMIELTSVQINRGSGLAGDRFNGREDSPRQVTLMQQEHLAVIAACVGRETIAPAMLRRNIVVSGINLLALKDKQFHLGGALLEYSGACHPCSKMEAALGSGGYNAMRGHGGITARVLEVGRAAIGDPLVYLK